MQTVSCLTNLIAPLKSEEFDCEICIDLNYKDGLTRKPLVASAQGVICPGYEWL